MKKILSLIVASIILQFIYLRLMAQVPPPPPPPPSFYYYNGDLSVSITKDSSSYDKCLNKFRHYYDVVVLNTGGDIPFTFLLKTTINDFPSGFFYTDGSNETGRAIITNLGINESRTINGYVLSGTAINPEGPDINVKVSLPSPGETVRVGRSIYMVRTDINLANNIAIHGSELPYLQRLRSPFDNLNVITMPPSKKLAANLVYNASPYDVSGIDVSFANGCYTDNNLIGLFYYSELQINFVKVRCLDSGKPVYFMKCGDKYITSLGIGNGVMLKPTSYARDPLREWVFVQSHIPGRFYIYNVYWGTRRRLKIVWTFRDFCPFNALVMAVPDENIGNQLFNLHN